ncbi:peptidoglycan-binding domain-containing protein [Glaciecola sp. 1036]|uniref:peptidoglycan-binding domain-containing protein n=1 Tax=Alteromonadaceae TaxID=72275 RepID=UPI003CFE4441
MAKVARSSGSISNVNTLVFHRFKLHFQTHPGHWGDAQSRHISSLSATDSSADIEYTLRINQEFAQSGQLNSDGSLELLVAAGHKAELDVLGTIYELNSLPSMASIHTLVGIQQRLQRLGYLSNTKSSVWDESCGSALLSFQADHDITPTGEVCDKTKQMLESED